jgi:hypothetical protein
MRMRRMKRRRRMTSREAVITSNALSLVAGVGGSGRNASSYIRLYKLLA